MAMTFSDEVAIRTLWQEARGEGAEGLNAVAHVILNRMRDGRWGGTAASVCLWRSQFSGWLSTDPNFHLACGMLATDPALAPCATAWGAAQTEATDPTDSACFYYATSMASPPVWSMGMIETVAIGRHKFFRDK